MPIATRPTSVTRNDPLAKAEPTLAFWPFTMSGRRDAVTRLPDELLEVRAAQILGPVPSTDLERNCLLRRLAADVADDQGSLCHRVSLRGVSGCVTVPHGGYSEATWVSLRALRAGSASCAALISGRRCAADPPGSDPRMDPRPLLELNALLLI